MIRSPQEIIGILTLKGCERERKGPKDFGVWEAKVGVQISKKGALYTYTHRLG